MRRALLGVVCLGALVLGCTASEPGPADPPDAAEPSEPAARPCDDEVVSSIDATVAGQLEAFAADDFEAALGFASRSFRSGIDAVAFRALILEAYPNLTDSAEHRSGACLITGEGVAEIRIEVTGEGGVRDDHLYLMVAEDGRWLVEAAVTPDDGDRTLT